MKEIDLGQENEVKLLVGSYQHIIIDKLYGPTAACDLKISIDMSVYQWVIERFKHTNEDGLTGVWEEVARVDMQPADDACWKEPE